MTETIGAKVNRNIDSLEDAVQNAQSLDELCAYVNKIYEIAEASKDRVFNEREDDFLEMYGVNFEKAREYVRFMENSENCELPLFTEEEEIPGSGDGVWSWDNERMIVSNPMSSAADEPAFVIEDRHDLDPDETPTPTP